MFVEGQMIHIQAECPTCDKGAMFAWSLVRPKKVPNVSETSRLVLNVKMLADVAEEFEAEVSVWQNNVKGLARIQLKRHSSPKLGQCLVSPVEGEELTTEFRVKCRQFQTMEPPLSYTFFQGETLLRRSDVNDFHCSLLNTASHSTDGLIRVEDALGARVSFKIALHVKPFSTPFTTAASIKDFIDLISDKIVIADNVKAFFMLNMLSTPTQQQMNTTIRQILTELLLQQINSIKLDQIAFVQMALQFLIRLINPSTKINAGVVHKSSAVILKSCKAMLQFYLEPYVIVNEQDMIANTHDVIYLADQLIQPFETIPFISDDTVPIPVDYPFKETYSDYEDFNPDVLFTLKDMLASTTDLHESMYHLSELFGNMVQPEEENELIKTGSVTFLNIAKDLDGDSSVQLEDHNTMVTFDAGSKAESISVTAMVFQANPYWWYPESIKLNSDVLMIFSKSNYQSQKQLRSSAPHLINIYTRTRAAQSKTISGMVAQKDDMPIYQLTIQPNAVLFVTFNLFCAPLRVHLKANLRPKYHELVKSNYLISNAFKHFRWTNDATTPTLLFMAIAPDDPPSFDDSCDFTFDTYIGECRNWRRDAWSTLNCQLGANTTENKLHCVCQASQTVFAAQMYVAPNNLDLPRDLMLSLDQNQVLIVFVVIISLLFTALMLWAWQKDRVDKQMNIVHYVHIGGQMNPINEYLITVATGLQKNAATSSQIHVNILGSCWSCPDLQLEAATVHKLFRAGTEENFLIRTDCSFGRIDSIIVWISSGGREPSWFCEWIRIRDVCQHEDWIFPASRWFSAVLGKDPSTIHSVALISEEQFHRKSNMFRMHLRHGLTDRFMWYSIWRPFPRSSFTRKQRLLVAMASLATSMVTNLMFFGRTTKESVEDENDKYAKLVVALRMLSIVGQSVAISLALGFMLTLLFRWSKRNQPQASAYKLMFR